LTSVPNEPPARLSGTYTTPNGSPADVAKARRAARDWAWRIDGLDPTARLILMAYADHVRADGQATLGVPRLMKLTELSRRSVQKWLSILRDRGLLVPGDQSLVAHLRADQRPTVYRVSYEPMAEVIELRGVADDASSRGVVDDTPSRGVADDASLTRANANPRGVVDDARVVDDAQGCKTKPSTSLRSVEGRRNETNEHRQDRKRGTRLPDDWTVTDEMKRWVAENCPELRKIPGEGTRQCESFVDYWRGRTGAGATKLDWLGTWRNWMRRAEGDIVKRGVSFAKSRGGRPEFQAPERPRAKLCQEHPDQHVPCPYCAGKA
jgi:hypothetical protein